MTDLLKNNFLGCDVLEKILFLNFLNEFLDDNTSKKLKREFINLFGSYEDKMLLFIKFCGDYKKFNSNVKRKFRKTILEYLIQYIENHHVNSSPDSRRDYFMYNSDESSMEDKIKEYVRYFKPKVINYSTVKGSMNAFESYSLDDKINFVNEFMNLYSRLNYFSFPLTIDERLEFRRILVEFVGEDMAAYYDLLYPEEQMRMIDSLLRYFEAFDLKDVECDVETDCIRTLKFKVEQSVKRTFY